MNGWTANDMPDQSGRVVVITGANSGVGYESAVAFARKGAHVIMACRSLERAERARCDLWASVPGALVEILQLDLGSLHSINEFANRFEAAYDHLDILMNNAGIMSLPYGKTADGFEQQFGTNHLGHFALTGLLLPTLLKTPKSRIVTVSSSAAFQGRMNFDDLQGAKQYGRWSAYSQSKLANILFARELQSKLEAAGVDVTSIVSHPGYAATNLQSHGINALERTFSRIGNRIASQSAEQGATSQLYAATAPEARGGEFYGPKWVLWGDVMRIYYNSRAANDADAARLWEISEQLTGVCYEFIGEAELEYA